MPQPLAIRPSDLADILEKFQQFLRLQLGEDAYVIKEDEGGLVPPVLAILITFDQKTGRPKRVGIQPRKSVVEDWNVELDG